MPVRCELGFGTEQLRLELPDGTDLLAATPAPPLADPAGAIRKSLVHPIGAPSLAQVIREKRALVPEPRAAVAVSDNTRPVPYRGESGILEPILEVLRAEGVTGIDVLVANGTHRELTAAELRRLLPESAFVPGIEVVNHRCADRESLVLLGTTARGTQAWVNRRYVEADLKVLTGLVEPHFMAGASGGAKSVCPGLAGRDATWTFHGARMLADERAASLVLEGNPCQAEAREVAAMAGVDFIVNVTLDGARRVTGVYAGDVTRAHDAAVADLARWTAIPIEREYDLVVTHAGFAGINHYQSAKAAVEAAKAVRPGGTMVLAASHTDPDPVGGPDYRRMLALLAELGPEGYRRQILAPDWEFVPEQWEPQMWARALGKLGEAGRLVYCAPRLTGAAFRAARLPGVDGGEGLTGLAGRDLAEAMVRRAVAEFAAANPGARCAALLDGPYAVPVVKG